MQDDDIHAFTPPFSAAPSAAPSAAGASAAKPSRRPWLWVLGGFVLLSLVALMASLTLLGLMDGARDGLNVVVGSDSYRVIGPPGWEFSVGAILAGAVAFMVVLVVVPLVLAVALLCIVLTVGLGVLACAVGLAVGLGSLLLVLTLALSPLWVLGLILWLLLRRPRRAAAV